MVVGFSMEMGLRLWVCVTGGFDGGCCLWVAMVVAGMGRLGVLGSHGGCRLG